MSLLLGVLLLVSAAQAQEPTTTSSPATAPVAAQPATGDAEKTKKDEKKICRREASTESRLGAKRICLTAEQWRARQ